MGALPKRRFTPEEYIELEIEAEYKSQYVGGEIFAMAGMQPEHIEIMDNLTAMFRNLFRDRPCRSYSSEMKVRSVPGELWTYPDLTIVCGKPEFSTAKRPYTLLNPQVIFEILSPSTEAFDRGDKFSRYRRLESLKDYVLVSSDKIRVEHYSLQDDRSWKFIEYEGAGESLLLASIECELPLADIYDRVVFSDPGDED